MQARILGGKNMSKVTMKSTKQEIMDALLAATAKLEEKEHLTEDPLKAVKDAQKQKEYEHAEDIVTSGILNPEYTQKWEDLNKAIASKEKELSDLYGIEAKANTMAAIINAYKQKEYELKESFAEKEAALKEELDEKKTAYQKELDRILEELKDKRVQAEKKYEERIQELEQLVVDAKNKAEIERQRDEEVYSYNLSRQRKLEEDAYADKRAAIEKEVAEIKAEAKAMMAEADRQAEYITELEIKVEEFPEKLEAAVAEAEDRGNKAAGKEYGYQKAMYMKEKEYEIKSLEDANARLSQALVDEKEKVRDLTAKLDESYQRMQELAATTVQSNGGVKILDRESVSGK